MTSTNYYFPEVTLLVTHYNRSNSLENLLHQFQDLNISFHEIIVSDDGSKPEHLHKIKDLQSNFDFRLVTTPQNKGLGNNINKGQAQVMSPYTLYVQEDFLPKPAFAQHFRDALDFMQADADLDIVRFYAYFSYPTLKPFKKGFSEMVLSPWSLNHLKFYYYSDHPHLRRTSFSEKFGPYAEGVNGDLTEYRMCISFIQNKGKGLFFNNFTELFDQVNTSQEPSTATFRSAWKQESNSIVRLMRLVYLRYKFLKFRWDVAFLKLPSYR
ncbi:glycosyltransferase [Adhaeribacter radiodurans]|uniref:Glycosyltransferase family 2 protein n=1 Tax=Adhaeribacter radiodurans TaxID=2745197 RepID=A0A7L7L4K6_9BACT|nr:glycosyltransferase family 2 protein [Adhaeribacter radiodurans]QMU27704.1 glycosyltransferase family 2 protein [Adhaeribacter radiodurans]